MRSEPDATTNAGIWEARYARAGTLRRPLPRDHFLYGNLLATADRHCRPGDRVLDVGCGVGAVGLYLAHRGCTVLGIDTAQGAVESCRRSAKALGLEDRATFETIDASQIGREQTYDVVLCFDALEHMPDDLHVLRMLRELLSPGGRLLLSVPSPNATGHRRRTKRNGTDPLDAQAGHLRRYTADQISDLVRSAGLTVDRLQLSDGPIRALLVAVPGGRFAMRCIRWPLTPLLLWLDRVAAKWFGEGQVIVTARD